MKENDPHQANTTKPEKRKQRNALNYDMSYEQSMANAANAQFNRSTKPKQQQAPPDLEQVKSPLKHKTNLQQSPKKGKPSNIKKPKMIRPSKKKPRTTPHNNAINEKSGKIDRKKSLNTPPRHSIQEIRKNTVQRYNNES